MKKKYINAGPELRKDSEKRQQMLLVCQRRKYSVLTRTIRRYLAISNNDDKKVKSWL